MKITTELPIGFLILCILLGAVYSAVLYFKKLRNPEENKSVWPLRLLAIARFLSVTFLAILLLNPLLKYRQRTIEKPAIILAIDNSESIVMVGDSVKASSQIQNITDALKEKLKSKYEIITVLAGEEVKPDLLPTFKDQITDLSTVFNERDLIYTGDNLIAQILISDGIINQGANPSFLKEAGTTPFYAMGVGDTTIRKDVRVYEAKANAISFLGNTFPIEVIVNADKSAGAQLELGLYQGSNKISSVNIQVNSERFSTKHTFLAKADKVGTQQYEVRVSTVSGESHIGNNRKLVYTDVLDGRQKVAIVTKGPHPDIGALRAIIESNDQYEVTVFTADLPVLKSGDYDLVISHQMPVNNADFNYLQQIKLQNIPLLHILGAQTDINLFNRLEAGLKISGNRRNFNQSLPNVELGFSLFELSDGAKSYLAGVPPLLTPFGDYTLIYSQGVLLKQKIGQVNSNMPLMCFNDINGYRSGIIAGEGLWRWRMNDYEFHEHFDHINELISRTIQYLSVKGDKRKFRLYTSSKTFAENDVVSFFAEVYNESFEFTPYADVKINLTDENGKDFSYALSPSEGMYRLRLGTLPAGRYTYSGTAQYNGKIEKASGVFVVKALDLEKINLTADFGWMRKIASQSGGGFYNATEADKLAEDLLARKDAQALSNSSFTIKDVIDQKWIFFLIVLLLVTEWFARRWMGGY